MRTGIPPVPLTVLAAVAMWVVARLLPNPSFVLRHGTTVAVAIVAVGLAVCLLGVLPFRRAGTTVNPMRPERASALVTDGIYRLSRNPMYLGMLLVLVGWGAHLASVAALLVVPSFVLYLNRFQIVPEERALAAAFGEEYAAYARRVRRWI